MQQSVPIQQLCRNPLDAALAAIKRQRVASAEEARHVSSAGSQLILCCGSLVLAPPGQALHSAAGDGLPRCRHVPGLSPDVFTAPSQAQAAPPS